MEVNFEPYRAKLKFNGRKVDSIELFRPQRDFAYQDSSEGKRNVVVKCGIFYEFVKSDEFYSDKPRRLPLRGGIRN
jgi:hypothetical protein